jgi:hypothetical protein
VTTNQSLPELTIISRLSVARLSLCLALASCSGPATLVSLQQAEVAERKGQHPQALALYRQAQVDCKQLSPKRRRDLACAQALLGEAELEDNAGNSEAAIIAYQAIALRDTESKSFTEQGDRRAIDDEPADGLRARASYRLGALHLAAERPAEAYRTWWWAIANLPNEGACSDILASLVRDARVRNPDELMQQLEALLTPLAETGIADNLLWWLADLAEQHKQDKALARSYYDRIYTDHATSGLRDDSRWRAAQLSIQLDDHNGAITRLRGLLATREVALGPGSYFSIWLDDGLLLLGQLLRDKANDLNGAIAAFTQLPIDYPASILRDDALYQLALTQRMSNATKDSCASVKRMNKQFADSKWIAETKSWECAP